jgi:DNA-binding GntR family transcriptional regulator|tara:strand:+ start:325 stop:981 length:657 start_codon:yes stop_codon:yes gene_type:complete
VKPPEQIWKAIAQDIKEDIIAGVYNSADWLKETELSEKYSVSKTPVREALRYLGGIGIVEIIPNRRARISQLEKKDVQNLYCIQAVLEGLAVQLATPELKQSHLVKLERFVNLLEKYSKEGKSKEYEKANIGFHSLIWRSSGNEKLLEMINGIYEQLQRFRSIHRRYPERFKVLVADHRKILEAIYQKDGIEAERLIRLHTKKQEQYILEILKKENMF